MIDKAIGIGSAFDWITPLWSFIQDYRNRPAVGYNIPVESGWSAYAIQDLLQDAGIKIWGLAIYQDTIVFSASQAQASYVQYWLDREGIPYQGGIHTDSATPDKESHAGGNDWLDSCLNTITSLVDIL